MVQPMPRLQKTLVVCIKPGNCFCTWRRGQGGLQREPCPADGRRRAAAPPDASCRSRDASSIAVLTMADHLRGEPLHHRTLLPHLAGTRATRPPTKHRLSCPYAVELAMAPFHLTMDRGRNYTPGVFKLSYLALSGLTESRVTHPGFGAGLKEIEVQNPADLNNDVHILGSV